MSFRTSLLLGAAALLPMHSYAQPPGVTGMSVELRAEALVDHARIVLSDVAVLHADGAQEAALKAIDLGRAPRVGYVERFSRAQIEQAIRHTTANAGAVNWSGAAAVAVRTEAQTVAAQTLSQAAVAALQQRLAGSGGRTTISVEAPPADVLVPAGQLELRPRALPAKPQNGRAPVWIDLHVNGELYRSVVVQLAVSVHRQAYLARHAIDAGNLVTAADFEIADADVPGTDALQAGQPLAPFRAARSLRTGQPLTSAAMLAGGTILRGDQVRLTVRAGAIGVDTAGVAMDDAGPGQAVRVRPSGSQDIVTGRLGPSGAVIID
jgi:flagella basal body P-ring formation protein FlgA